MSQHKITVWLEINGEEKEATVEFDYSKGHPGQWWTRHGEFGLPPDPPEIEVGDIKIDGLSIDEWPRSFHILRTSEEFMDKIEQACWDHIENERESREADAYDHWKASKETT